MINLTNILTFIIFALGGAYHDDIHVTDRERLSMSWEQYYDKTIQALGYEAVKRCVPFELPELRSMYRRDRNFNIKQKIWQNASGLVFSTATGKCYFIDSPLRDLLRKNGITLWSQAEAVCLLKRCAERMVTEHD